MIGYAANEIFSDGDHVLWLLARRFVEAAPDYDKETKTLIRCHELARAVGELLGLRVCDGKYGFVEHSWLWLSEPEPEIARYNMPKILDVYVPGSVPQVQLVDTHSGLCHRYLPDGSRTDVSERIVGELVGLFKTVRWELVRS